MGILDRPPLHLTADDMLDAPLAIPDMVGIVREAPLAIPDMVGIVREAPLAIPDMVGIVREALDGFLDGHHDLADRNVAVAPADPLFAGMLRLTVDSQAFDVTVTEAAR